MVASSIYRDGALNILPNPISSGNSSQPKLNVNCKIGAKYFSTTAITLVISIYQRTPICKRWRDNRRSAFGKANGGNHYFLSAPFPVYETK